MAEKKIPAHIKIARKAFASVDAGGDLWWNKRRVFSEWEAWQYLIACASWAPHNYSLRSGKTVVLERGETRPLANRYLMGAWGWTSKKRVTTFIAAAQRLDRIVGRQRTTDGDTYLIVNYAEYQFGGGADGGDLGGESGAQTGAKEKTRKSRGNNTATETTDLLFDVIWNDWPKKTAKDAARREWSKLIVRGDPKIVEAGIYRYIAYLQAEGTEKKFVKKLSNFLKDGEWQDEWTIEGVHPIGSKKQEEDWWVREQVV